VLGSIVLKTMKKGKKEKIKRGGGLLYFLNPCLLVLLLETPILNPSQTLDPNLMLERERERASERERERERK